MLFILALPVFIWLRWNPVPWFNVQLESNGLTPYIQVEQVEKSGLGLHLGVVHIKTPGGPDINLNGILLNPAWFRIIRGAPALHIQGTANGAAFALNISMQDGAIWLHDMDLLAQADVIRDYIPQAAMLNLTGSILMSGDIKLRQHDALPLAGAITMQWKNAASGLLRQEPLGDFQLQLASSKKNEWKWQMEGGKTLSIDGKGHLSSTFQPPEFWQIDGNIHTQSQGRVASLLSDITGHDRWNLVLSGALLQPHLEFLNL